jgi:hypothetical protein
LELLWKRQVSSDVRTRQRSDLAQIQGKVDYLKNVTYISPQSECNWSARRTLVKPLKKIPKEVGMKSTRLDNDRQDKIFILCYHTVEEIMPCFGFSRPPVMSRLS